MGTQRRHREPVGVCTGHDRGGGTQRRGAAPQLQSDQCRSHRGRLSPDRARRHGGDPLRHQRCRYLGRQSTLHGGARQLPHHPHPGRVLSAGQERGHPRESRYLPVSQRAGQGRSGGTHRARQPARRPQRRACEGQRHLLHQQRSGICQGHCPAQCAQYQLRRVHPQLCRRARQSGRGRFYHWRGAGGTRLDRLGRHEEPRPVRCPGGCGGSCCHPERARCSGH